MNATEKSQTLRTGEEDEDGEAEDEDDRQHGVDEGWPPKALHLDQHRLRGKKDASWAAL